MAKIQISLKDPETRAVWESAMQAKREVASWPAWKRGESPNVVRGGDNSGGYTLLSTTRFDLHPHIRSKFVSVRVSQRGWT